MNEIIRNLLSEFLVEDDDIDVILSLFEYITNKSTDFINRFPDLIDVDNVAELFLPQLSALVGYRVKSDIPIHHQRAILRRYIEIAKTRGTDDSIIMAATYGDYKYWVGSHLFYPDGKADRDLASIDYASNSLFIYDMSSWDTLYRYTDSVTWREGVLVISVPYLSDEIRKAVLKNVPGGVKIYFRAVINLSSDESDIVKFGEWKLTTQIDEEICAYSSITTETGFTWDEDRYDIDKHYSGHQVLMTSVETDTQLKSTMISEFKVDSNKIINNLDYPTEDFKIKNEYKLLGRYDIDFMYDTKFNYDGYLTQEYISLAEIEPVSARMLMDIKNIERLKVDDYLKFYNDGFEVVYI